MEFEFKKPEAPVKPPEPIPLHPIFEHPIFQNTPKIFSEPIVQHLEIKETQSTRKLLVNPEKRLRDLKTLFPKRLYKKGKQIKEGREIPAKYSKSGKSFKYQRPFVVNKGGQEWFTFGVPQ